MSYQTIDELLAEFKGKFVVRTKVGMAGVHYDFSSEKIGQSCDVTHAVLTNAKVLIWSPGGDRLLETMEYPPFSCEQMLCAKLVGKSVIQTSWDLNEYSIQFIFDDLNTLELRPSIQDVNQYMGVYCYPKGLDGDLWLTEGFMIEGGRIQPLKSKRHA